MTAIHYRLFHNNPHVISDMVLDSHLMEFTV